MASIEQRNRYAQARAIYRGEAYAPEGFDVPTGGGYAAASPAPVRSLEAGAMPSLWDAPNATAALAPVAPAPTVYRGEPVTRDNLVDAPGASYARAPMLAPSPMAGRYADRVRTLDADIARGVTAQQEALGRADERLAGLDAERKQATEADAADSRASEARVRGRTEAYQAERKLGQDEIAKLDADIAKRAKVGDSRDDGQKVMGLVAAAFAGVADAASAMGGARTDFQGRLMANIERMIDRDIARQREELANLKDSRQAKVNALGMSREAFGDDIQAEQYLRGQAKDRLATQIGDIAARTQNSQARAQLEQAQGALLVDATQARAGLVQNEEQMRIARANAAARGQQKGIDWSQLTLEQLQAMKAQNHPLYNGAAEDALNLKLSKQNVIDEKAAAIQGRAIDGLTPTRPLAQISEQSATKARESTIMFRNLETNLRRMKELSVGNWSPTASKEFDRLRENTIAMTTQASGSGVPGAGEAARIAATMPDAGVVDRMSFVDRGAVYDQALVNVDALHRNSMGTYGYSVAKPADPNRALEAELGAIPLGPELEGDR